MQVNGALEIPLQAFPVPVVQANVRQRSVRLAQLAIELERFAPGRFRLAKAVLGRHHAAAGEHHMRVRQAGVRRGVVGLKPDRLLVLGDALAHALFGARIPQMPSPQIRLVRPRIERRHPIETSIRSHRERDLDFPCDGARHLCLQREDVMQLALVTLRPQVSRIAHPDQLRCNTHPTSGAPHAALQKMRNTEFPPDLLRRLGGRLVLHGGGARDHAELLRVEPRQLTDHLLGQALAEVIVLAATAQVLKRQHHEHQPPDARCGCR